MMFSNVIVDVSFPRRSLVFSQSCCELSSSFSETGSVAVGAIELYIFFKKRVKAGCNVCFSVVPCLSCLLMLHYVSFVVLQLMPFMYGMVAVVVAYSTRTNTLTVFFRRTTKMKTSSDDALIDLQQLPKQTTPQL